MAKVCKGTNVYASVRPSSVGYVCLVVATGLVDSLRFKGQSNRGEWIRQAQ